MDTESFRLSKRAITSPRILSNWLNREGVVLEATAEREFNIGHLIQLILGGGEGSGR